MNSQDVFVYCEVEQKNISQAAKEILSVARQLADQLDGKLKAVLTEPIDDNYIEQFHLYGVDEIIVCDIGGRAYDSQYVANAVANVLIEFLPQILLLCSNYTGRSLAPWIASHLKTGATADCIDLSIDPITKKLIQTRPAFGGNLMADIICEKSLPQIATVRSGVFPPIIIGKNRKIPKVVHIKFDISSKNNVKLISSSRLKQNNLQVAKIVLAGGRGIGEEGFVLLKKLSKLIGPSSCVAGTRVAVDLGNIEYNKQIGQTGFSVRPKLYCAFGISGASEHVAGIINAEKILAVNIDPNAKIFDVSDYKIVGDAVKFIEKLINKYNV